jgi:hypothetical protein
VRDTGRVVATYGVHQLRGIHVARDILDGGGDAIHPIGERHCDAAAAAAAAGARTAWTPRIFRSSFL